LIEISANKDVRKQKFAADHQPSALQSAQFLLLALTYTSLSICNEKNPKLRKSNID